jgi:hypothetical protein
LFAREDYVEEAWRIVDPVLKSGTPLHEYDPNSWGPDEVERVTPLGGWRNPIVTPDKPEGTLAAPAQTAKSEPPKSTADPIAPGSAGVPPACS